MSSKSESHLEDGNYIRYLESYCRLGSTSCKLEHLTCLRMSREPDTGAASGIDIDSVPGCFRGLVCQVGKMSGGLAALAPQNVTILGANGHRLRVALSNARAPGHSVYLCRIKSHISSPWAVGGGQCQHIDCSFGRQTRETPRYTLPLHTRHSYPYPYIYYTP